MKKGAEFSEDRKFRYSLWRVWDESKDFVMFIGLNPSTANEASDDPTIRRVVSMAKAWGYGGVYMMNCFPFVSTYPEHLNVDYSALQYNDKRLVEMGRGCSEIIFAWGNFPIVVKEGRDTELKKLFPNAKCLIQNKNGSPRHPLYVPSNVTPILFS